MTAAGAAVGSMRTSIMVSASFASSRPARRSSPESMPELSVHPRMRMLRGSNLTSPTSANTPGDTATLGISPKVSLMSLMYHAPYRHADMTTTPTTRTNRSGHVRRNFTGFGGGATHGDWAGASGDSTFFFVRSSTGGQANSDQPRPRVGASTSGWLDA